MGEKGVATLSSSADAPDAEAAPGFGTQVHRIISAQTFTTTEASAPGTEAAMNRVNSSDREDS